MVGEFFGVGCAAAFGRSFGGCGAETFLELLQKKLGWDAVEKRLLHTFCGGENFRRLSLRDGAVAHRRRTVRSQGRIFLVHYGDDPIFGDP